MSATHAIILFDGVCNFCNRSINFAIKHDKRGYFQFAPLQSSAGERLQRHHGFDPAGLDTFILIERGEAYDRSTAALRVMHKLSAPYSLAYALIVVPKPIRDFLYDQFARRRYRWFGKRDACMIPSEKVRARFLVE